MNVTVNSWITNVTNLQNGLLSVASIINGVGNMVNGLQNNLTTARSELAALDSKITTINSTLNTLIASLLNQISDKDSYIVTLQNRINELDKLVHISDKDSYIVALQNRINELDKLVPLRSTTIYEGKGLYLIQVNDTLQKVLDACGTPDSRVDLNNTIWLDYKIKYGIDFLLTSTFHPLYVVEIRFNNGFDGSLINGLKIGSALDEVLTLYKGPVNSVKANYDDASKCLYGSHKILYEVVNPKTPDIITSYKYIDAESGILFWFSVDKKITQIVVFQPY